VHTGNPEAAAARRCGAAGLHRIGGPCSVQLGMVFARVVTLR
jgi:hypothetical protein